MAKKEPQIYQLKVGIVGSRPPIWRRVLVPARMTLAELHEVIQVLMGWRDSHLHEFETPGPREASLTTRGSRRDSVRYGPTTDPSGEPMDWLFEEDAKTRQRRI